MSATSGLTPEMQAWVDSNLANCTPLTVGQIDTLRAEFGKVTVPARSVAA